MRNRTQLFEESPALGGYSLAVRDDWNYKIKRVHLSEKEKEEYLKTFGEEIISYSEFMEWWTRLKAKG